MDKFSASDLITKNGNLDVQKLVTIISKAQESKRALIG